MITLDHGPTIPRPMQGTARQRRRVLRAFRRLEWASAQGVAFILPAGAEVRMLSPTDGAA